MADIARPKKDYTFFPNTRVAGRGALEDIKRAQDPGDFAGKALRGGLGTIAGFGADVVNTGLALAQPQTRALSSLFTGEPGEYKDYGGVGLGGRAAQAPAPTAPVRPPANPNLDTEFEQAVGAEAALRRTPAFSSLKPTTISQPKDRGELTGEFLPGQGQRSFRPPSTQVQDLVARAIPKEEAPALNVELPTLSSGASFGDLLGYRMGLLNAGANILPQVARRNQVKDRRENLRGDLDLRLNALGLDQERELGYGQLELDQAKAQQEAAETAAYHNVLRRGQDVGLQKALAGRKNTALADMVSEDEARRSFINSFDPQGPTDPVAVLGQTALDLASAYSRMGLDVSPVQVRRLIQEEISLASQTGEVNLDEPANMQQVIDRVRGRLDDAARR